MINVSVTCLSNENCLFFGGGVRVGYMQMRGAELVSAECKRRR